MDVALFVKASITEIELLEDLFKLLFSIFTTAFKFAG
jgi:hypothetical protein